MRNNTATKELCGVLLGFGQTLAKSSVRAASAMSEVIFGLMLWLWLKKDFIGMFARECLQGSMGKDVLAVLSPNATGQPNKARPEIVNAMIKRALNAGIWADYLLADAWFGTKAMVRLSQKTALVPVLRMKKNKVPEAWIKVRLLFVRGNAEKTQTAVGKHEWGYF